MYNNGNSLLKLNYLEDLMSEENKRPIFEPPLVRDLSALSAQGGKPQGACKSGVLPFYDCVVGTQHPATDCLPGINGDSSACGGGAYHLFPSCTVGFVAATVWASGFSQQ